MAKKDGQTQNDGPVTDRRRLLLGLGLAGTAAAGAMTCPMGVARAAAGSASPENADVADAPVSDTTQQRQPFYGVHQSGIVTPRPASGMIVAFDVLADDPAAVERLLRTLTERFAFLTQGGAAPELDPKFPPADNGILGPVISPDNLTMTLSLGASFFDKRPWLGDLKPSRLTRMPKFANDALDPDLCHGDLSVQICANTPDANIHALRDLLKSLPDLMVLRWKQEGSVPTLPRKASGETESARNFLGFRDGSANPRSDDDALMARVVWTRGGEGEPAWSEGGTYQALRIIRNFVERWDRTPLGEQQRIIGRLKASGAPLSGGDEASVPDFAADPDGKTTPLDAHIRLANPRMPGAERNLVLRRPFNYSNGVTKAGQLDQGLLFIAYQADLDRGFAAIQKRLDGEPLEEYIKPVGGGYFFTLPGVAGPGDFLGSGLLRAASASRS